jgi:DNA polymerase III subunit delta
MSISVHFGDEEYLLQQSVVQLRQKLVDPGMGSLGHKQIENPSVEEVLEAIGAVYFNLGGKTLIEIHNFAFLHKAASAPSDERAIQELMQLLESVDENKHVAFISEKVNRTIKFPKWLLSNKKVQAEINEFKALNFWQTDDAIRLLMQECKHRNLQIEPKAAMALVDHLGTSMRPLLTEVEKLSTYAIGRAITVKDVALLCAHDENTFRMLADWLHQRNQHEVFGILEEILLRQHPIALFALIQSWLGNLFRLRYWQKNGLMEKDMADRSKKHPFKIKKDLQEFAHVPFERFETLREKAIQLEWQAKSGQLNARLALEILMAS